MAGSRIAGVAEVIGTECRDELARFLIVEANRRVLACGGERGRVGGEVQGIHLVALFFENVCAL